MTVAGKNYSSFDDKFLSRLSGWEDWVRLHRRVLDPGSLYFDPTIDDQLPNLAECKRRANLSENVSHTALEDAWDVCQLIRNYYHCSS